MIPPSNPSPSHPNKLHPDGTPGSVSQQGMPSNQFQGNPAGFYQNPAQVQAQAGMNMMMNQQMTVPFNNFVPNLGNGSPGMSTIGNVNDNPYIAMHKAMSMLGMPNFIAQGQMPFGPQGSKPFPVVPMLLNQNQPTNLLLPNPPVNMPQLYNQNVGFPNQNLCLPSPMQNNNQFMPNFGQGVLCNMPPYPHQNFQPLGIQMPVGIGQPNGSMSQGNQSQNLFVPPQVNANSAKISPSMTQPSQGNSSLPPATNSFTPTKDQQNIGPPGFPNPQMNGKKDFENTSYSANWKNSPNRHQRKNNRQDTFQRRLPNGNFQNGKRKFNQHGWHDKKESEHKNDKFKNIDAKNSWPIAANQTNASQTRLQDISQWLEERKKNYPSKANIEKKQTETDPAVEDSKAILRRQELKEVLAKQAELGVEVAEIPAHYLLEDEGKSSSERKHGREGEIEDNGKAPKKGKRFKNKSIKRSRRDKNKKLKVDNGCTGNEENPELKKSLLQKLLGEDIRREKIHLLQVFRFMTMNSFFKEWPEKPLLFPSVTVSESGVSGGPQSVLGETVIGSGSRSRKEEIQNAESCSNSVVVIKGEGNEAANVHEEEGEIID